MDHHKILYEILINFYDFYYFINGTIMSNLNDLNGGLDDALNNKIFWDSDKKIYRFF